MITKCKGLNVGNYRIPPFELFKGELIWIQLDNRLDNYDFTMELMALFTGLKTNPNLEIFQQFEFVEHFKESFFLQLLDNI